MAQYFSTENQLKTQKMEYFIKLFSILQHQNVKTQNNLPIFKQKSKLFKSTFLNHSKILSYQEALVTYGQILQRYQKLPKNSKYKKNWSELEIKLMSFMVFYQFFISKIELNYIQPKIWIELAFFMYTRTPLQIQIKWMSLNKFFYCQSPLEKIQVQLLRNILNQYYPNRNTRPSWSRLVREFNSCSHFNGLIYRSARVLKNYWRTNICEIQIGDWKPKQDQILLESVLQFGKKWSKISNLMNNRRTPFAVKNRYDTLIKNKIKGSRINEMQMVEEKLNRVKDQKQQKNIEKQQVIKTQNILIKGDQKIILPNQIPKVQFQQDPTFYAYYYIYYYTYYYYQYLLYYYQTNFGGQNQK